MTDKKKDLDNTTAVKRTVVNIQPMSDADTEKSDTTKPSSKTTEIGGRKGLEPTRYGDWEKNGRCIDF